MSIGYPDNCILKFKAVWCVPCRTITPQVHKVGVDLNLEVIEVDVDTAPDWAEYFQIQGVPTLVRIKDGKEAGRTVGTVNYLKMMEVLQ